MSLASPFCKKNRGCNFPKINDTHKNNKNNYNASLKKAEDFNRDMLIV